MPKRRIEIYYVWRRNSEGQVKPGSGEKRGRAYPSFGIDVSPSIQ
jgi:hypothetical protein